MLSQLSRPLISAVIVVCLLLPAGMIAAGEGEPPPPVPEGLENGGEGDYAGLAGELAVVAAGGLIMCGDAGQNTFLTTSSTYVVLRQCTLTVPAGGVLFISADGTADDFDGYYEAQFDLSIDSTLGAGEHDRWVAVSPDSPGGEDNTLAVSAIRPVTAGTHTVYLLVRRYLGSGTVTVFDSSLSVIYIPSSDTEVLTCSEYGQETFETTEETYQIVRQCSLTAPAAGWAYVAADATGDTVTGYYEVLAGISIDDPTGVDHEVDRRFDMEVHATEGDTDATLSVAGVLPVSAGSHDFYFSVRRSGGAGTVRLYDPAISVLYVPFGTLSLIPYSITQNASWSTTSGDYEVIRQMPMVAPSNGYAFISANAWVKGTDVCRGHFRIGVDLEGGDLNYDRWVALYPNSAGDADKALAISALVPVTAGEHTVYLVGEVYSGSCELWVYDSTLTILVLPGQVFAPLILR
jgi:hypothetical protein